MLEEYETRRKEVEPLIDTIYLLSDAGVKRKITELRTIINRRLDILQSNLEKHLSGDAPDLAETLNLGKLAMERVSEKMREIEKSQNELLVEGNVSKARYEGNAPLFLIFNSQFLITSRALIRDPGVRDRVRRKHFQENHARRAAGHVPVGVDVVGVPRAVEENRELVARHGARRIALAP